MSNHDDGQVNPILRAITAIVVFSVATGITVMLAVFVNTSPYGFTNDTVMWGTFAGIWILLMFIGFRISQSILQRR